MTEKIIVRNPRTRFIRWIGGGVYRTYGPQNNQSFGESVTATVVNVTNPTPGELYAGMSRRGQQFITPSASAPLRLNKVSVRLRRTGSPTGTMSVSIFSDSNNLPGTSIALIGTRDVSTIATTFTDYDFVPSTTIALSPNTKYWVVVEYNGGNGSNYISMEWQASGSDSAPSLYSARYTTAWTQFQMDYSCGFYPVFRNSPSSVSFNLDYQYVGVATKRLRDNGSKSNVTVNSVTVNGQNVGNSLEETDSIPQATAYTITYNYAVTDGATSYTINSDIQRYLYYDKTTITLDDIYSSEAYVQRVTFLSNGSVLRFDDNPDSDLIGNANTSIVLSNMLVPFRKLEWIQGSGEVDIYAVD